MLEAELDTHSRIDITRSTSRTLPRKTFGAELPNLTLLAKKP
jgi:hypothetical protein